jgi:hypothetical protein
MIPPEAVIRLEQERYRPGDLLAGAFVFDGWPPERYTVELSVLWRTEGKGDEDLGVILFREWSWQRTPLLKFDQPQGFEVSLPRAPLSYKGVLIKIHWLVRVRLRWEPAGEQVAEVPFELGPQRGVAS